MCRQQTESLSKKPRPNRSGSDSWPHACPFGKLLVAVANKHARQIWAMLARGEAYDAHAWIRHPMVQRNASRKNVAAEAA